MENYSIHLPSYSIGDKVYNKIPEICGTYGKKIIAIGGHKAINAAREKIEKAIEGSDLEILDFLWYGGEAPYENVEALMENQLVKEADIIFAIGGGKSTDTGKCLGVKIDKPVFSFPTIASAPSISLRSSGLLLLIKSTASISMMTSSITIILSLTSSYIGCSFSFSTKP